METVSDARGDTRSKIVDVAARLLRNEGPAAVTTRGVAEGAGVQAPTIYRLFGDKDGLLEAVAEHVLETFVASKSAIAEAATAADVDPLDDLRSGWHAQIEFGVGNPMLFGFLHDPERGQRSAAVQSGKRILEARVARVAVSGRLRVSEERAVDLIRAGGVGTVTTILATPPAERDPGLADAMFEAVLHQILTDAPERPDDGPKAAAVAFRAIAPRLEMLTASERGLLAEWVDRAIDGL